MLATPSAPCTTGHARTCSQKALTAAGYSLCEVLLASRAAEKPATYSTQPAHSTHLL